MLKQRGSWRKWVGGKPGLWYFVPEKQRKTADRPHPATLVMGALSPLLAIVATIISLRSLSTSQMSMRVSQRAYVTAEGTEFKASFGADEVFVDEPIRDDEVATPHAFLSCTLRNLGNTPATILDLRLENKYGYGYSVKRVVRDIHTFQLEDTHQFPKELPSKGEARFSVRYYLPFDAPGSQRLHEALKHYLFPLQHGGTARMLATLQDHNTRTLHGHVVAEYQDIFKDRHKIEWEVKTFIDIDRYIKPPH